jgi:myosin heavy subunit
VFNSIDVCNQLRCAGMLEAIRIRKAGYAIRVTQDDFSKRYKAVLGKQKNKQLAQATPKVICDEIFK